MKTIGLIGGVASGKSTVARTLADHGAGLLDADRTGHDVLDDDEVVAALRERWGDSVFSSGGSVDRKAVAARVFGHTAEAATEREFLEGLLHPRIRRRLEARRDQLAAAGCPAVVLDAPLLLEAGWRPMCDVVILVDTPRELRLHRARSRGWSEAEFDRREASQMPLEEKRELSDIILPNDSTEADLRRAVDHFWRTHIAS